MTAQPEHSQCPLVEMGSITSLFIVYRYDSTTGTFTVPPGGNGFYYLSTFLLGQSGELGSFEIEFNGERVCTAYSEQRETSGDDLTTSCTAIAYASEGTSSNVSYFLSTRIQAK